MANQEEGPRTFLRFGIQRKKEFLRDAAKAYDGIVLPANVLLYQYKSTPMAIYMSKKPFFVDPMSYLFGQPYEHFKKRASKGTEFKPSFRRLMEEHGLVSDDFLSYPYTRLLSLLEKSDRNTRAFTDAALRFQTEKVWDGVQAAKELMSEEEQASLKEVKYRPEFAVPPYFLYEPQGATALLNGRILDYCWSLGNSGPELYPMVFVLKEHLGTQFAKDVVRNVRTHDFPGYCFWVEDFDARDATTAEIDGLIDFVRSLARGGKPVVMLYGGFFGLLLYYFGVTVVCHGLAYGEAKAIDSAARQTSGPPPVRYYVRELHCFLTLDNALRVLRERPELMCECAVCRRVLRGDPENVVNYQEQETLAEMHFLYNRYQERRNVAENSLKDIVQMLDYSAQLCDDLWKIPKRSGIGEPIIDPGYISAWRDVLRNRA